MYGRTFGGVLDAMAARSPLEPAIKDAAIELNYTQAIGEVRAIGRALRSLGLTPGDRVGIAMSNSIDLALAMHGVLWAGLTLVPLNMKLGIEDQAYMLSDAGTKILLYHGPTAEHAVKLAGAAGLPMARTYGFRGGEHPPLDTTSESTSAGAPADVDPERECWIQYTGGTTGLPKGVVHSHRTMLSLLFGCAFEYEFTSGERHAHVAPLTHGGLAAFFPVWLRGGCNVMLGNFDPDLLLHTIESERITSTLLVPTMITMILDQPKISSCDVSSLRTLVYGAAPITASVLERSLETFGPILVQGYGQTEVFGQITLMGKADHVRALNDKSLLTSCGRAVAIAEVRLGDDDGNSVVPGESGEVLVRGPHVFMEYLNRPEETAKAKRNGWLHTGDVARLDDRGYFHLIDRKKDMIISGGFNIYPKEIELVMDEHPQVAAVSVVGVADEKWGEKVTAVVVAKSGADQVTLRRELSDLVRARKGSMLVPKAIEFFDEMPLTSIGKFDKAAIKAMVQQA